jgi:hypothetical protein
MNASGKGSVCPGKIQIKTGATVITAWTIKVRGLWRLPQFVQLRKSKVSVHLKVV